MSSISQHIRGSIGENLFFKKHYFNVSSTSSIKPSNELYGLLDDIKWWIDSILLSLIIAKIYGYLFILKINTLRQRIVFFLHLRIYSHYPVECVFLHGVKNFSTVCQSRTCISFLPMIVFEELKLVQFIINWICGTGTI